MQSKTDVWMICKNFSATLENSRSAGKQAFFLWEYSAHDDLEAQAAPSQEPILYTKNNAN